MRTIIATCLTLVVATSAIAGGPDVPTGFEVVEVAGGFVEPVDVVFADDGRMFVAEQRGTVRVVADDGTLLPDPFIDLRDEVNGQQDRGLLGIALDPDFPTNRHVYLLYTVDPVFGPPDEPPASDTFGRLTRYTGTAASGGSVADLGSRKILLGEVAAEGFPACHGSHTIGTVRFGFDGSLLAGSGDGAFYEFVDQGGGADPGCLDLFGPIEDIGAFRSQYLESLAGKIVRIDPTTGKGLPGNPYYTGNGNDNHSRVWVSGLRNPTRFTLRPGTPGPGTLYIADVGWNEFEEINVGYGGENFGWPCYEGFNAQPGYQSATPAHSGCETIETEENPGPLTSPLLSVHHWNPNWSFPPGNGFVARAVMGGRFYTGSRYPARYHGTYFFTDWSSNWIRVLRVNRSDEYVSVDTFGEDMGRPARLACHPDNGDILYVSFATNQILRIIYTAPAGVPDNPGVSPHRPSRRPKPAGGGG